MNETAKNKDEFVWTDELVNEFSLKWASAKHGYIVTEMEKFKASKQRKPLFETEDGVGVFEFGVELVCVEKDFNIRKTYISPFASPIKCNKYFSTEATAKEYVMLNKPMYSLNQAIEAAKESGVFAEHHITIFKNELEKLHEILENRL